VSERDQARARSLQGRRAGFVSRMVAAAIDIGIVLAAYELVLVALGIAEALFTEERFELPTPSAWLSGTLLLVAIVLALAAAWAGAGRTLGDSVIGLRVVREDGQELGFPRAVVRGLVLVALPFFSMGWILVSRKNAGLHDLVCRTTVVYDWRPRSRAARAAKSAPVPVTVRDLAPASGESRQDR
jgi:uncharacterized RDD family membrane protein YckC